MNISCENWLSDGIELITDYDSPSSLSKTGAEADSASPFIYESPSYYQINETFSKFGRKIQLLVIYYIIN